VALVRLAGPGSSTLAAARLGWLTVIPLHQLLPQQQDGASVVLAQVIIERAAGLSVGSVLWGFPSVEEVLNQVKPAGVQSCGLRKEVRHALPLPMLLMVMLWTVLACTE
jgi:hypothetical protein